MKNKISQIIWRSYVTEKIRNFFWSTPVLIVHTNRQFSNFFVCRKTPNDKWMRKFGFGNDAVFIAFFIIRFPKKCSKIIASFKVSVHFVIKCSFLILVIPPTLMLFGSRQVNFLLRSSVFSFGFLKSKTLFISMILHRRSLDILKASN